jgi:hypothetical protein
MMTRDEHLAWSKRRAHEYLDLDGDVQSALQSMMSDLFKHDGTKPVATMMMKTSLDVMLTGDIGKARRFIDGFT